MMSELNIGGRMRDMYAAQNEPENLHTLAEIFWRLLLFCTLIGVIAVIGYGSWEFFGVTGNLNSNAGTGARLHTALNRAQLETVLSDFQLRAQKYQSLQTNFAAVADPSK